MKNIAFCLIGLCLLPSVVNADIFYRGSGHLFESTERSDGNVSPPSADVPDLIISPSDARADIINSPSPGTAVEFTVRNIGRGASGVIEPRIDPSGRFTIVEGETATRSRRSLQGKPVRFM